MNRAWLQDRPHLAALARSMQAVLELADRLYERGRSSGEAVDYSEFEEQVARMAAEVEIGVHQVVLSGLDVDASFIKVDPNTRLTRMEFHLRSAGFHVGGPPNGSSLDNATTALSTTRA
jgi:hypothetical protein